MIYKFTDKKPDTEKLARAIDRFESLRDLLFKQRSTIVHDEDEGVQYEIESADVVLRIVRITRTNELPTSPLAVILSDGFCRHGDALERTAGLPVPDSLYDDNFRESKRSHRCGCAQCGAIFDGIAVTEMSSSPGGRDGMAFCPVCGSNTVIAEDSGVEVNDDNLWRWHQHTFGEMPMYKDLPEDMSKLTMADVMRRMR